MSPVVRRMRGAVLRLIRRRATAVIVGIALIIPAAWMQMTGSPTWWADGLSLVLGATGAALLWTGIFGLKPDWVE
jgi:hypothetical protein